MNLIEELLEILGVRLIRPLGGRLNQHWLVGSDSESKVLRRWTNQPVGSIEYERLLLRNLAVRGWPVAPFSEPVQYRGALWSLSIYLAGEPIPRVPAELRSRGRLLAQLHAETKTIPDLWQRPGWRRAEAVLADSQIDELLSANEASRPEEVRILRWHLDRARLRAESLPLAELPSIPVHGDFATWNLLYSDGNLTALLDFELAHQDHRIADFCLAWRGKYDEVIQGYEEVAPLEPVEAAAIVPVWWASLIETTYQNLSSGFDDQGWTIGKLLARSPLMGPDAEPFSQ